MSWTVTIEEEAHDVSKRAKPIPAKLHIRAIIDIDNEQAEIKELIASLQKYVKEQASG